MQINAREGERGWQPLPSLLPGLVVPEEPGEARDKGVITGSGRSQQLPPSMQTAAHWHFLWAAE